ncbi:MAG: cysteine desulfurase family protein [Desulfovibrionaceae bacterium]|nr:cysteine desulfurase family protein [Desulfovibrionaceae bacterium]
MGPLYFDFNATTPVLPEVLEAMLPYLRDGFGNPGSGHLWGLRAREAVDRARAQTAGLIGADPEELIFTSCATESNCTALYGAFEDVISARLAVSAVEHPSVLEPAGYLKAQGIDLDILPVDNQGVVELEAAKALIKPETRLVSVMLANNETGAIQPVAEIARAARRAGALVHSDAAQACGKIPVDVDALGVDLLTLAGHKLYAPKGVGALYLRCGTPLAPLLRGGGQERGLRSGTENVAQIVGLGAACELAARDLDQEMARQRRIGRVLLEGIEGLGREFMVMSGDAAKLPNTLNVGFKGLAADRLVEALALDQVGVSAGAACHSGGAVLSPVLAAMAAPVEYAAGALRLSWGRTTDLDGAKELLKRLARALEAAGPRA